MLTIKENDVYPVNGSRFGGIAHVTQIVDEHVFGRVLICDKEKDEYFQRDFHGTLHTVENHQNFELWNGRKPEDGELVTVEACDCITNIGRSFI